MTEPIPPSPSSPSSPPSQAISLWTPASLTWSTRAPKRLTSFAQFYLPLCLALVTVGFWNSDRLFARADMLADPIRPWALAGIDTLAPDSPRARLSWIHKALLESFPLKPIALSPLNLRQSPGPLALTSKEILQVTTGPGKASSSVDRTTTVDRTTPHHGQSQDLAHTVPQPDLTQATPTIFFVGDSLANGYAAGASSALARAQSRAKSVDYGKISTGLVSKSYFDWQARVVELCRSKPTAFVVSFGANDPTDMREGALFVKFGSPEWNAAYASRASAIVDAAHACGAKVAWLRLPPMREEAMSKKTEVISLAQSKACEASDACITPFSDLGGTLQNVFSERALLGGKRRLLRAQDGIHMAPEGYLAVAKQALIGLGIDLSPNKPSK